MVGYGGGPAPPPPLLTAPLQPRPSPVVRSHCSSSHRGVGGACSSLLASELTLTCSGNGCGRQGQAAVPRRPGVFPRSVRGCLHPGPKCCGMQDHGPGAQLCLLSPPGPPAALRPHSWASPGEVSRAATLIRGPRCRVSPGEPSAAPRTEAQARFSGH